MPHIEIVSISSCEDQWHLPVMFFGQPRDLKPGECFELKGDEVRVGRHLNSELKLPLPNVSKCHFRLVLREGRYAYEDIGSRQIPIYNGERLMVHGTTRLMEDGDTFNAAGVLFRYHD
ncbi:MAG: Inner rane component of cytoplasmic domain [Planctomycetota bacterium]|nr:Inner rane component of cytoplasmic domain [Planctomycetota bacterium]